MKAPPGSIPKFSPRIPNAERIETRKRDCAHLAPRQGVMSPRPIRFREVPPPQIMFTRKVGDTPLASPPCAPKPNIQEAAHRQRPNSTDDDRPTLKRRPDLNRNIGNLSGSSNQAGVERVFVIPSKARISFFHSPRTFKRFLSALISTNGKPLPLRRFMRGNLCAHRLLLHASLSASCIHAVNNGLHALAKAEL